MPLTTKLVAHTQRRADNGHEDKKKTLKELLNNKRVGPY